MKTNAVNKNSRAYLQKQIGGARSSLLMILIFTVVNVALLLIGADDYLYGEGVSYFVFAASLPYYLVMFGISFDYGISTFTITALVITAVILGLYLLCWIMSKKKPGWLIFALVLFIVDSIVLVLLSLWLESLSSNILDILIHIWALVELIQAVVANGKLKKLPPEMPVGYQNYPYPQNGQYPQNSQYPQYQNPQVPQNPQNNQDPWDNNF